MTKAKRKTQADAATKVGPNGGDYTPTAKESEAIKRVMSRRANLRPSPKYKVNYIDGRPHIDPDHPDGICNHVLLMELLSVSDTVVADGLLTHIANVAQGDSQLTAADLNVMLAIVNAVGPRDPTEALLATQMAAIHKATIYTARRFNRAQMLPEYDSAGNQLNKLARTFTAQVEALKRYRSSGEQSIRVQHVTVNEGGQAVVGNVPTGGGGTTKNASQSHALGKTTGPSAADAPSPALLGNKQALGMPLPSPGGQGKESLPDARRQGGSPERKG